ncbi:beta 1-4 rhamnosyltransferase Cps2T [Enterococcus cecorum]|uniref:beta 1-4 rhamnosyltransferase Cps2T n=1 Tax=Enterococcus cecorum TaxID=44008 RepID=UPI003F26C57D
MSVQHVYIVGSKGAGNYGGFETFVDKLTEYHQNNKNIQYHIAWKGAEFKEFEHNGAHSFQIKVPNIGPAQAIYYDVMALNYCIKHIKENDIENPIIYVLACRIGPFAKHYQRIIHKLGGKLFVNPDGHEWLRAKWSAPVRKYWKLSEELMVKSADLLICDSKNIEKYIIEEYSKYNSKTVYISYGATVSCSKLKDDNQKLINWYKRFDLHKKEYYLVVGRFVPENNYETMIREFMNSSTKKNLAIITNANDKFLSELDKKLNFRNDSRIKFVGTVYDKELLMKIREEAYGYIHGHEVGGTNPSLLEALYCTNLNLLLDVCFNKEVAQDSAFYWNKNTNNLSRLLDYLDKIDQDVIDKMRVLSTKRIVSYYSWEKICMQYEKLWIGDC